jgi:CRP-like cAMP-binding protein
MRRGTWFGHRPLMTGRRRILSAQACEPTSALQVPLSALERIIVADPAAARHIGAIAEYNHEILIAITTDLLIRETDRRIAAVLLRITAAEDGVEPDDPRGFPLTQQLIGDLSNASRDTVNRVLASLAGRGWISWRYGRAYILDVEALAAFAAASTGASINGARSDCAAAENLAETRGSGVRRTGR